MTNTTLATCRINYEWNKVVDTATGKTDHIKTPLSYIETVTNLLSLADGTLGRIDDMMFAKPLQAGDDVRFIGSSGALMGYLGTKSLQNIDWMSGATAMPKDSAFLELLEALPKYKGIETVPHEPPMERMFYNHPPLPEPDYNSLWALLDRFEPATEEDRAFILAMFVTAVWGGPVGQRPMFLVYSRDGRGVGKSTVAEMAANILGQEAISASTKQNMSELVTRLLSKSAVSSRVVILDNETGRVASSEMAGLVTSQTISGRRLYAGEGKRPNNLIWVMTLNTPTLDSDLASRSIPINVKRPKFSPDWKTETANHINKHRWGIISALIDILKTETPVLNVKTRWGSWENQVLSKVSMHYSEIEQLQDLIKERQEAFDDEADEIGLIRDGIVDLIKANGHNSQKGVFFVSNAIAADICNDVLGTGGRRNTALRDLKGMCGNQIRELQEHRHPHWGRGLKWQGKGAASASEIIRLVPFSTDKPFEMPFNSPLEAA